MKIILLQDVKPHGKKGDLIDISDGYARNFLIPKKMAVEATSTKINEYNQKKEKEARIAKEKKEEAMALKAALDGATVAVKVKTSPDGKMFGSVTAQNICDSLAAVGHKVEKKNVTIKEPIKQLGVYTVEIWVYANTTATVKVNVVKE